MSSPQSKGWAGGLSESPERWADVDRKTKLPPDRWSGEQNNSSQRDARVGQGISSRKGMLASSPKAGIDGFK